MTGALAPLVEAIEPVGKLSLKAMGNPYCPLDGDKQIVEVVVFPRIFISTSPVNEQDWQDTRCTPKSLHLLSEPVHIVSVGWGLSFDNTKAKLGFPLVIPKGEYSSLRRISHATEQNVSDTVAGLSGVDAYKSLLTLSVGPSFVVEASGYK